MNLPAFKFRSYGDGVEIYEPCLILKPEMVSFGDGVRIDSFTKIEGGLGVTLAKWSHLSSFGHINIGGGRVDIGIGVGMGSGVKVLGGSNSMQGLYVSCAAPQHLQEIDRLHTVVSEGAFIGSNAIILPGVTIGEFAVIGAGAVVTHDVPAREIWAGVPARKIGER